MKQLFRSMLASLLLLMPAAAKADPHCWCEFRVGGCDGTPTSSFFDAAIHDYRTGIVLFGQINNCRERCADKIGGFRNNSSLANAVCRQFGEGTHRIVGVSWVGRERTFVRDRCRETALGTVNCKLCECSCPREDCSCPAGYATQGEKCEGSCIEVVSGAGQLLCGVPSEVSGLSVREGRVSFDAACARTFELRCGKCYGSCLPRQQVSGLGIVGGQIVFDASCSLVAEWR